MQSGVSQKTKTILIVAVLAVVLFAMIGKEVLNAALAEDVTVVTETVGDFFIDIDNDGDMDTVLSAVIIRNTGARPVQAQPFSAPTPMITPHSTPQVVAPNQ